MDPSDCHILVVDDERISQVVVSSLLRKCNYKGKRATTKKSQRNLTVGHSNAK